MRNSTFRRLGFRYNYFDLKQLYTNDKIKALQ